MPYKKSKPPMPGTRATGVGEGWAAWADIAAATGQRQGSGAHQERWDSSHGVSLYSTYFSLSFFILSITAYTALSEQISLGVVSDKNGLMCRWDIHSFTGCKTPSAISTVRQRSSGSRR